MTYIKYHSLSMNLHEILLSKQENISINKKQIYYILRKG